MARSRSRSTSARTVTSVGTAKAPPPMRPTSASSLSAVRAAATTRPPRSAISAASAAPIPSDAPVMTTTLPS